MSDYLIIGEQDRTSQTGLLDAMSLHLTTICRVTYDPDLKKTRVRCLQSTLYRPALPEILENIIQECIGQSHLIL